MKWVTADKCSKLMWAICKINQYCKSPCFIFVSILPTGPQKPQASPVSFNYSLGAATLPQNNLSDHFLLLRQTELPRPWPVCPSQHLGKGTDWEPGKTAEMQQANPPQAGCAGNLQVMKPHHVLQAADLSGMPCLLWGRNLVLNGELPCVLICSAFFLFLSPLPVCNR